MDQKHDEVTELWGCGFNQFCQIDETGDDVYELTRIDFVPPDPWSHSLEILWAGWSDLICKLILTRRANLIPDLWQKSSTQANRREFKGLEISKTLKEEIEAIAFNLRMGDCLGNENVIGAFHRSKTTVNVVEKDGNEEKISRVEGYIHAAVSGNGYVAALVDDDTNGFGNPPTSSDKAEFRDASKLEIFGSLKEFLSPPEQRRPLLELEIFDHEGYLDDYFEDEFPDPSLQLTKWGTIGCLSAGDAHFSFTMDYRWPKNERMPGMIQYYNNIWTIRTDTRSINDDAWIPLVEELSPIDECPQFSLEGPGKSKLPIFCAAKDDDPHDFTQCRSAGWITAGISGDKKAWIFPFGRAFSKAPNLPIGRVDEVDGVLDLALGDGHIVLRTQMDEVWTFGANDHGQRGFRESESGDSWRKLDIPKGAKVKQIACGRWNTFIVLKRKQDPENSDL
jgi:Regulator of chromosome condensation (RCC1) repeat